MKKYLFLLVSFLFLIACGTDSRKAERTAQPTPPTAEPEIQASNSVNPAKSTLDQEIEKMTAAYQRGQVLLDVREVEDQIEIESDATETVEIDRTKDATYFVRIVNMGTTPKLIIDRFYEASAEAGSIKHLTKEIPLKNAVQNRDETIYESGFDHNEKTEMTDEKVQHKSKTPRYRVVYKDGQWDVRYQETETLAIGGDEEGDASLFGEILALPEVKKENINSQKVKKIELTFSVQADTKPEEAEENE